VRVIRDDGNQAPLEHFWLCGRCSLKYEFALTAMALFREEAAKGMVLPPNRSVRQPTEECFGDLSLWNAPGKPSPND
jgi:hypothetical protein